MKKFELILIGLFFIFSFWLMDKSFHYDVGNSRFLIARNEVGDFGLHLGLIRSFSYGNNFPPQLPFFPDEPLPYHYYFDFVVGMVERLGVRIDYAFNILSALSLSGVLYLLYRFPQMLFDKKNKLLGLYSVFLFLFPSSFTFVDFFKTSPLSPFEVIRNIWRLPDLIHKGPFDGSVISIFFTLSVYLNQRHLIAALAISMFLLYVVISRLLSGKTFSTRPLLVFGVVLGLLFRIHALIFFGTCVVLLGLSLLFKKYKMLIPLFSPAILISIVQINDMFVSKLSHPYVHPGFIIHYPLTLTNVITFWLLNLGMAFFLIPLSLFFVPKKQQKIFFAFLPLFVIGNIFQFSYRIEHNHSLFNLFFMLCNFYIAFFLYQLSRNGLSRKCMVVVFLLILTFSGILNLMAIKNDFLFPFEVEPKNLLMQWVIKNTDRNDIFLAKAELLDPITISGRRNYLGNRYYLSVMGYDSAKRSQKVREFFQAKDTLTFRKMRDEHISYIVIPQGKVIDFDYSIDKEFLEKTLRLVYKDKNTLVFKL